MTDKTPAMPELPEPALYAHELILNGGGVWLGVPEKGICEQAYIEGEIGEEIRDFYTADQMRAYALAALQSAQPAAAVSDEEIEEIARGKSNHIEFARAIRALRPQAVPMTEADTVQVYGIKNGEQTLLGTAPMPPRMKAHQLAREQFGHFEDGDGSDAELCFRALKQMIEHMGRIAHHGITQRADGGEVE